MQESEDVAGQSGSVPELDAVVEGEGERTTVLRSLIRRQAALASAAAQPTGPKAELYRGFGDGFARAFELAVTPVVFGAMGYGLDRWLGIVPLFTTVFVLLAVIGLLLRTWYGYVYRMKALEEAGPWATKP